MAAATIMTEAGGNDTLAALHTLHQTAHKLVGTAGTFGFSALAAAGKRVENNCTSIINGSTNLSGFSAEDLQLLLDEIDAVVSGTEFEGRLSC